MKSKIFTSLAIFCSWLSVTAQGIVQQNGLLQVNGNQIVNENNQPFSVAGNSMFWSSFQTDGGSFYTTEVVNHLAQDWGSQLIRAAMGVEEADESTQQNTDPDFPNGITINPSGAGYYNNPDAALAKVKTIIDAAIANDIYVIVDYHTHFAHFFKDEAITFFTEIATTYGNNDHIIYEIFNEPIGTADNRANDSDNDAFGEFDETWNTIVKPYAIDVINAIRAIDPDNLIVVGTPGFSQGVESAAANPITAGDLGFNDNADLNIAYTLHFYAGQQEHDALISSATSALSRGIALFVTEWGTVLASGKGEVDEAQTKIWMNFLRENNISHANWSVSDKPEGASIIQPSQRIQGLLDGELTESGSFVRCIIQNWQDDAFENCSPIEVVVVDSEEIPNGQGAKIEAESGNGNTSYYGNSNTADGGVIEIGEFDEEGILENLGSVSGQFSFFGLPPSEFSNGDYTFQFVVSSNSNGNSISSDSNGFTVDIPNTGGLNNYEIVTIQGVSLVAGTDNIDISFSFNGEGSGSFNFESVYVILDSEFDEVTLSVPTFDAELASSIRVYPIPAVDVLNVETAGNEAEYSILGLNGAEIISRTDYENGVDVSGLNSGIYFIQLYINGQSQAYKFVKE